MSFLRRLLGDKTPTRDDQIVHLVKQAQAALDSCIDFEEYKRLTPPIEALWLELLQANPDHTPIRVQAVVCAVAQFVGLHMWSEHGSRLSEEQLVPLAQGFMLLELANQFMGLTPGGQMRELFGQMITAQALARQASTPIVLCKMGQQEQAREMFMEIKRIALMPDDRKIEAAMRSLGGP